MLPCQRPSPSHLGQNSRAVMSSAPGTRLAGEVTLTSSPQTILLRLFLSQRCLPAQSDSNAKRQRHQGGLPDLYLQIPELGCGHSSAGSMMTVRKEYVQEQRMVHNQMEVAHRSKIQQHSAKNTLPYRQGTLSLLVSSPLTFLTYKVLLFSCSWFTLPKGAAVCHYKSTKCGFDLYCPFTNYPFLSKSICPQIRFPQQS